MITSALRPAHYLRQSKLFCSLSNEDLDQLDPQPDTIDLAAGETLIRQGESGTDYFFLISGRLRVFKSGDKTTLVPVAEIYPGDGVGEMSLITGDPRSATVVARHDSKLLRLTQQTLLGLVSKRPETALEIARLVTSRLSDQAKKPKGKRNIAVIPLSEGIDAYSFAKKLTESLASFGHSRLICDADSPNRDGTEQLQDATEDSHFAVFAGAAPNSAWTRFCFLRADLVLLVVRADEAAPAGLLDLPFERGLDRSLFGRIDLVLLHEGDWHRRCETAAWIARLIPAQHHHIRADQVKDFRRLGRIITDTALNLVLSGGGARAFTQLGVLKAFSEVGICIDRVAGASMGAFAGALFAYDGNFDDLIAQLKDSFRRRRPERDLTLPMLSLFSGKRLQQVGADLCNHWRIEDLPIRYFCVSARLDDAQVLTHFDGPLTLALRSSCALPMIGPPLYVDGSLLIDGGVLNNLPIDLMRQHFSGPVAAVNVSVDGPIPVDEKWDLVCPSGFEILWNKLNPFTPTARIPSIVEMFFRTLDLTCRGHQQRSRDYADWLIEPPVQNFKLLDFNMLDELVAAGYNHTMGLIDAMRKQPGLIEQHGLKNAFSI